MTSAEPSRVRLAELVATISLGTDLGLGQSMEHVIRQTVIALRMGDLLGLPQEERVVLYYSGLLAWVGCHTDAYEQAKWFGDDIDFKREAMVAGENLPALARLFVTRLGSGRPPTERLRTGLAFPLSGARWFARLLESHWRTTDLLAERLGLSDGVRQSLRESYERWDGKGAGGLVGEQIRLTSRVVYLADVMAAFERHGGRDQAVSVARERSGTAFDPELSELFCAHARDLLDGLDAQSHWSMVLDSEPGLEETVDEQRLDDVLAAIGDFSDLKSPYFIGHSRTVADLAGVAAGAVGLNPTEATCVRRAGLVHDFGRLGVSNSVWDKAGPLNAERDGTGAIPSLSDRTDARLHSAAGGARCHRRAAPRTAGRLGIPAWPLRKRDLPAGQGARRGRLLLDHARAATPPSRGRPRRLPRPPCATLPGREGSTAKPSRRSSRPTATGGGLAATSRRG